MDTFIEIKNKDVVKIPPRLLNSDLKTNILHALQRKYEGVCSKFGYIKRGSVRVVDVNNGEIETSTFHGYVNFRVSFLSQICNPAINSVVRCVVRNINSFGILCAAGYKEGDTLHSILNVVVPKQNHNGDSDYLAMIDMVNINDHINVEILGKKYILHNKSINVFGRMVAMGDVDVNGSLDNEECTRNGISEDCDDLSENDELPDALDGDSDAEDDNGNDGENDADDSVSNASDTSVPPEDFGDNDDLSDVGSDSELEDDM